MTRRPFIAGNWKLHMGPDRARQHAESLRVRLLGEERVDLAVFPTDLSIGVVTAVLHDTAIHVGVQHIAQEPEGAWTGQTSARHARLAGCHRALIGHSEVRQYLGVTDEGIHQRARQCLSSGMLPVICLGESLAQREAGHVEHTLLRQLELALGSLEPDEVATCTVAYEPVWAIGTGKSATPAQVQEVHGMLRTWLRAHYPGFVADQTRILYGGSVKPNNASEILAQPDVDGALVGGASLDVDAFTRIVEAASAAA